MRESIGLLGLESLHYYVHDLARSRRLFVDQLDFAEQGVSDENLDAQGKQHSVVFTAGGCRLVFSEPRGQQGRAWRFLRKHPEGVGTLVFSVSDVEATFRLIESRGGTPISDVEWQEVGPGRIGQFSITTPFGDTTFRFVERQGQPNLFPGFRPHPNPQGGSNRFGFTHFDHVTSNFPTMQPVVLWLTEVMGFERYWGVEFHTQDVAADATHGSGLKSIVMWDPVSGVKFALNEPARPFFRASQINVFNEEHRGPGVQHVALAVTDILEAVSGLRSRGVSFLHTPDAYYEALPERMEQMGVGRLDESIETLRSLGILVDGEARNAYLLQIFLKEASVIHADAEAGPFFLEVIQRRGDNGFGAGNFRALFESIEREQQPGRV